MGHFLALWRIKLVAVVAVAVHAVLVAADADARDLADLEYYIPAIDQQAAVPTNDASFAVSPVPPLLGKPDPTPSPEQAVHEKSDLEKAILGEGILSGDLIGASDHDEKAAEVDANALPEAMMSLESLLASAPSRAGSPTGIDAVEKAATLETAQPDAPTEAAQLLEETTTDAASASGSGHSKVGITVGVAFGSVALIAAAGTAAWHFYSKRKMANAVDGSPGSFGSTLQSSSSTIAATSESNSSEEQLEMDMSSVHSMLAPPGRSLEAELQSPNSEDFPIDLDIYN